MADSVSWRQVQEDIRRKWGTTDPVVLMRLVNEARTALGKGRILMVTCPKCGKTMQRKGLFGHLRFLHLLTGDELNAAYHSNVDMQEKQQMLQEKRKPKGTSDLHARLLLVRMLLPEVKAMDESGCPMSDEAANKLRLFLEAEEKQIAEIDEPDIPGEDEEEGSKKEPDRPWDEP
jgi:adenine-specific DNA methylase